MDLEQPKSTATSTQNIDFPCLLFFKSTVVGGWISADGLLHSSQLASDAADDRKSTECCA